MDTPDNQCESHMIEGNLLPCQLNCDQDECKTPRQLNLNQEGPRVPEVGMEFETDDHAYDFYNSYAAREGFSIRREWVNKDKNGVVKSRKIVCYKEGFRRPSRHEKEEETTEPCTKCIKRIRNDVRCGCMAAMVITLQPNGKYHVKQFESKHNHECLAPSKSHMLKSQRKATLAQAAILDIPDDSGIQPRVAFEFMGNQSGGRENVGFYQQKNYLHTKRKNAMKEGDAGALLQYFQRKISENKSFFYAIQLDIDDQIANIFWADAMMLVDYQHFGDVICFDTTYRTNQYSRPLAPFVGVNHHKQTVIFGVALLYDETIDSFKWLFETFIQAMSGKMPETILTDQDAAMANAILLTMPQTYHRICVWHMHQNALKHLAHVFSGSSSFAKDFKKCVYEFEYEEDFLKAWDCMLDEYALRENDWLKRLFNERKKWALVYGKDAFCADMKSTQLSGSFNSALRKYLKLGLDMMHFIMHLERMVEDRRYDERQADFRMTQSNYRLAIDVKIVKHARDIYTPEVFDMFQKEFIQGLDDTVRECSDLDDAVRECSEEGTMMKYIVTTDGKPQEHIVTFNSSNDTIVCSCKKFEFIGILCKHALKILFIRNFKELPSQYYLKRWTRNAKVGVVKDSSGHTMQFHPNLDLTNRYSDLTHNFNKVLARAAESQKSYEIAMRYVHKLLEEVEETLRISPEKPIYINSSESDEVISLQDDINRACLDNVESLGGEVVVQDDVAPIKKRERGICGGGGRKKSSIERGSKKNQGLKARAPIPKAPPQPAISMPPTPWPLSSYHPIQVHPPNLDMQGQPGFQVNPMVMNQGANSNTPSVSGSIRDGLGSV